MNKPNLYSEFKNDPLPLNAFLGIMTFACQNDYVDIVKYFYENKVKGVSKNITVNFYFTENVIRFLYNINKNSDNVKTYLRGMHLTNSNEDKIYEMLIHLSKGKKYVDDLTKYVLKNRGFYERVINSDSESENGRIQVLEWIKSSGYKFKCDEEW